MTQQPYAQPQYPGYPQQPPAQQFAPQPPAPQYAAPSPYPQQAYAPPAQPQQQPLAQGSLDDFYNQPSTGGGPSLKFEQIGTRYVGIVTRPLGQGDVQQQTDTQGRPLFFKDGSPKWVMKVPLQMQPSETYPDGTAQWYVKGATRDELTRAMAEAGVTDQQIQAGAVIDITFTGTRPSGAGMNPAKLFKVAYTPPNGGQPAAQAPVQQEAPQHPAAQVVAQMAPPAPQYAAPQAPPAQVAQPVQQQPAPQGAPQPPAGLDADQQALLARLTGQAQA